MIFPNSYACLGRQIYSHHEYSIVPIRYEDRMNIMKWRNEQIYHLRQAKPLTAEDQEKYFSNVVASLFTQSYPNQLLFSYLKDGICIGYGGLVHINWTDKNAEISFIINTALEKHEFQLHWGIYLGLLEQVAFRELGFHKIYTYAFDLRPHLYTAIEAVGFVREAVLHGHCYFEGEHKDVHIHSKFNVNPYKLRRAIIDDSKLYFEWANDKDVRESSFNSNPIEWDSHNSWFTRKVIDNHSHMFILEKKGSPVGQIRLDFQGNYWLIGFSVDAQYRGMGIGKELVKSVLDTGIKPLKALVKQNNISSLKVFRTLGFSEQIEQVGGEEVSAFYKN